MGSARSSPAPRNAEYKRRVLSAPYEICIERAKFITESYQLTEGEHPALRAARAFDHTLANMTIYILDCEGIVGNRSSKLVGTVLPIERGEFNTILELDLDLLEKRERQPFHIDPADKKLLREWILPYWRGRTVRDDKKRLWTDHGLKIKASFSPRSIIDRARTLGLKYARDMAKASDMRLGYIVKGAEELAFNNPALVMNVFDVQGHLVLGHRNVIHTGLAAVKERAEQRRAECEEQGDAEGAAFCEGVALSCEAVRRFAQRFADLACEQAQAVADKDPARRDELLAIAERCEQVPWKPPRDFREAIQSLWMTQCAALIAHGAGGIFAIGRADQYLLPYYKRDLEAGIISPEQARAILEELLIKLSYNLLLLPAVGKHTSSELGADNQAVTVGGIGPSGEDDTNDLSYLFMDAYMNIRGLTNSFSIRISEKSPPEWVRKTAEVFSVTSGPAVFNDEIIVRALMRDGVDERDARDYAIIGCVEPTSDGDTFGCTSGNDISLTAAVEMALFRGRLWVMGKRVGPDTGDPRRFASFDQFFDAYKKQVDFMIDLVAKAVDLKDQVYAGRFPNPFVSCTLDGCLDSARDMTDGGAKYNFSSITGRGLGTAADSLAAIRTAVFDEKTLSMGELLKALKSNFRGREKLRQTLKSRMPKFGCDDDAADGIAKEIAEYFCTRVSRRKGTRGGIYRPGFFSYGMHVAEGMFLGARPNGDLAGTPVSNSLSPANGSERNGPTAVMRSLSKIDHTLISNGCALNMKLHPSLISTPERIDKLGLLIRGYFAMGGQEVQFNVVDGATLRDAQVHPDAYPDLVVRVSGYSAYFTDLGKPIQDEIIARTEFAGL